MVTDRVVSRPDPGPSGDLDELDRPTCLQLLASADVGRLAWSAGGRVLVFPLNFALIQDGEGDAVIVRTTSAEIRRAVEAGTPLTFQADDFEPAVHTGWTVLASATATEITDPIELARLRPRVATWRDVAELRLLRLRLGQVAGRRLQVRPGHIETLYIDY